MNNDYTHRRFKKHNKSGEGVPFDLYVLDDVDVIVEGRELATNMLFKPLKNWTKLELIDKTRLSKEEVERGLLALIDNKYVKVVHAQHQVLYTTQPMWKEELWDEYYKSEEN